jgi:hypothetical protein
VVLGASNLLLLSRQDPGSAAFADAVAQVITVAGQPGSRTAVMSPAGGAGPRGIAAVTADGSVVMAMQKLSPTVGTEVYETWVVTPGADPVPVGSFAVGADGTALATMTGTPAALGSTLAITREPGPGATTPTLPILSSGVATGAES